MNFFQTQIVAVLLFAVSAIEAGCVLNTTYPAYLPLSVVPQYYEIFWDLPEPSSTARIFSGSVNISVLFKKDTSCIALNVDTAFLTVRPEDISVNGQPIAVVGSVPQYQQLVIHLGRDFVASTSAVLSIAFTGRFNTQAGDGLYVCPNEYDPASLSSIKNNNDDDDDSDDAEKEWMFATQFEPSSARKAFPSFDAPNFKAHFSYKIAVPRVTPELRVLTNTQESGRHFTNDKMITQFRKTMIPMSNYLVAIAVGHFDYVEETSEGVSFRIYTPPGMGEYGEFALNVSVSIVKHFGEIFGIPYSQLNTKMDQIAASAEFQNAMENQGLLIYWPKFLLCALDAPENTKELVALVVTHEIAHQWYGDTITTVDWGQEYLQEGFARYFQYSATDYLFPSYDVWTRRVQTKSFGDVSFYGWPYDIGMKADLRGLAPPSVVLDLNGTPSGNMLYEKGASINRMVEKYLGRTTFYKVLAYHVQTHKFTNIDVYDLMASFDRYSSSFSKKMLPWLIQPNFPVINIDVVKGTLTMEQTSISPAHRSQLWWIPINVKYESQGTQLTHLLEFSARSATFNLPVSSVDWFQADYNYTGFYIPHYKNDTLWQNLVNMVVKKESHLDQDLLIQQTTMLVQMSFTSPARIVALAQAIVPNLNNSAMYTPSEADVFVNLLYSQVFSSVAAPFPTTPAFFGQMPNLKNVIAIVGYGPPADAAHAQLQQDVLTQAVLFGDLAVKTVLNDIFVTNPVVPAYLENPVWLAAAAFAQNTNALFKAARNRSDSLSVYLQMSHTTTQCTSLINEIAYLPRAQQLQVIGNLLANRACRTSTTWKSFTEVSEALWALEGSVASPKILAALGSSFGDASWLTNVTMLLQKNSQYLSQKQISDTVTVIQQNIAMVNFAK